MSLFLLVLALTAAIFFPRETIAFILVLWVTGNLTLPL